MPDFDTLAALHAKCFVTPRPWSAAELSNLCDGAGVFLITEPSGFVLGRSIAGEAELLTIAVNPEARRQGIGGRLVAQFLSKAQSSGAESAFLEVSSENPAAIALYDSSGFQRAGKRKAYYQDPQGRAIDALVMTRPLKAPS